MPRSRAVRLEASRKNLALRSEELASTGTWTQSNVTVSTGSADPKGTGKGFQLTDASTAAQGFIQQDVTVTNDGNDRCLSSFIEKSTSTPVAEMEVTYTGGLGSTVSYRLRVDVGAGSVSASSNATRSGITDYSTSFYRPWIAGPNTSTGHTTARVKIHPAWSTAVGSSGATADTTGSNVFWGVQLEETT